MQAYDQTTRDDARDPFNFETTAGYDAVTIAALNAEFTARWNGWTVPDAQQFTYRTGALMALEDAIKAFQNEVAGR